MSFCQPVIKRIQINDQCNLKIRFNNGEVYEGALHLSQNCERMYDFVHLFFETEFSIKL